MGWGGGGWGRKTVEFIDLPFPCQIAMCEDRTCMARSAVGHSVQSIRPIRAKNELNASLRTPQLKIPD